MLFNCKTKTWLPYIYILKKTVNGYLLSPPQAKDELAAEGLPSDTETQESRDAIRQLTKTIDDLLDKMDKTEKGWILDPTPQYESENTINW